MRRASNRNVMAWTFMGNTRMHQVLREKGNKLAVIESEKHPSSGRKNGFLMLRNGHILNGF